MLPLDYLTCTKTFLTYFNVYYFIPQFLSYTKTYKNIGPLVTGYFSTSFTFVLRIPFEKFL